MIIPVGHNILIREKSGESTSVSGIAYKNEKKYGQMVEGFVEAVGKDVTLCKESDEIYYLAKSGDEIKREGESVWYIMDESQVKAIKRD